MDLAGFIFFLIFLQFKIKIWNGMEDGGCACSSVLELGCCFAPSVCSELLLCLSQRQGRFTPLGFQDPDSPVLGVLGQNGACTGLRGWAGPSVQL